MRFFKQAARARGRARFRLVDWLAAFGLLAALALAARELDRRWTTPAELAGFAEAVDGDSLRLGGREVRLKGIDAPELGQYCQNRVGRDYPCGLAAKKWLRARTLRGAFICRIEGADRYGRLLGVCSLGSEEVNRQMVRDGLAVAYGAYGAEEAQAREGAAGLWAGRFVAPQQWRREHRPDG